MADDREERIRKRAYEMWERDGFPEGQHNAHWQEAEAEIDAEMRSEGSASRAAGADDAASAKPKKTRAPRKPATSKAADASPSKATKTAPKATTPRKPRARKSAKPEGEG